MSFTIVFGSLRIFERSLSKAADHALDRMEKKLVKWTFETEGHLIKNKLSGQILKRRDAGLVNSITQRVKRSVLAGGLEAKIGTKHPGAAAHEFGATIVAKKAKGMIFEHPHKSGQWHIVHRVVIPKREPFAKALDDKLEKLLDAIPQAAVSVI